MVMMTFKAYWIEEAIKGGSGLISTVMDFFFLVMGILIATLPLAWSLVTMLCVAVAVFCLLFHQCTQRLPFPI